jgi:allophanate hydrolase subunit 1
VPEGAVGLADTWCGVYPTASPGGWRLIGRTDASLWDADRDQPALLSPGTRVRFVAA